MSNEHQLNQRVACDYYEAGSDRDDTIFMNSGGVSQMNTQQQSSQQSQSQECITKPVNTHISEDLWENTKRRHCDARQNMRHLLDRYMKPHL